MYSVVIIDDERDMLEALNLFFKRYKDVAVKTFLYPKDALYYIKAYNVDMVISDITMPVLDGVELLKNIKSSKPDLPVVMITADPTFDRVIKSHKFDACDFLIKPIDMKKLQQRVEKILGIKVKKSNTIPN